MFLNFYKKTLKTFFTSVLTITKRMLNQSLKYSMNERMPSHFAGLVESPSTNSIFTAYKRFV